MPRTASPETAKRREFISAAKALVQLHKDRRGALWQLMDEGQVSGFIYSTLDRFEACYSALKKDLDCRPKPAKKKHTTSKETVEA